MKIRLQEAESLDQQFEDHLVGYVYRRNCRNEGPLQPRRIPILQAILAVGDYDTGSEITGSRGKTTAQTNWNDNTAFSKQ